MSNTDNMSVLAIVSTQLLHQGFVADDRQPGPELPAPTVAVDLVHDDWRAR